MMSDNRMSVGFVWFASSTRRCRPLGLVDCTCRFRNTEAVGHRSNRSMSARIVSCSPWNAGKFAVIVIETDVGRGRSKSAKSIEDHCDVDPFLEDCSHTAGSRPPQRLPLRRVTSPYPAITL